MYLFVQLITFLYFPSTDWAYILTILTLISFILTVSAMIRHGDIRRFKTALPRFSQAKYFWLNFTSLIIITGIPLIGLYILAIYFNALASTMASVILYVCLNGPGIVYFIQTSSFFPKKKFKLRRPKYL